MHDSLVVTNIETKNQLDWTLFTSFRKIKHKLPLYKGLKFIHGHGYWPGLGIFFQIFFYKIKMKNYEF